MRMQDKYREPCTECGLVHWQANKTVYADDEQGQYCKRYRKCLECGHVVQTIQRPGSTERFYAEASTHRPRIKVYEDDKQIKNIKAPASVDEAMRMIVEGLAEIRGGY